MVDVEFEGFVVIADLDAFSGKVEAEGCGCKET